MDKYNENVIFNFLKFSNCIYHYNNLKKIQVYVLGFDP